MKNNQQLVEAKALERYAYLITRRYLKVSFLPTDSKDLGFTNGQKKEVFVAWEHELFKNLNPQEKTLIRKGIFAHELLHQLLTNFSYTNKICRNFKTQTEIQVFMSFANTLEDPAIEYFADKCLADDYVDALKFSIRHIYIKSEEIDKSKSAFAQLVNALIHFGDMGIVKGKFTFPEAKEAFIKIAPLYNKGITEPNNKIRLDIALECMELARPLWEEEMKAEEEFMKLLEELAKNAMQSAMSDANLGAQMDVGSGDGDSESSNDNKGEGNGSSSGSSNNKNSSNANNNSNSSSIEKRRNELVKKLEEMTNSNANSNNGSNDGSDNGSNDSSDDNSNDGSNNDSNSNDELNTEEKKNGNTSDNISDKNDETDNDSLENDGSSNKNNSSSDNNSSESSWEEGGKNQGQTSKEMSQNEANVQDALDLLCKDNKSANEIANNDLDINKNDAIKKTEESLQAEDKKLQHSMESDFDCVKKTQEKIPSRNDVVMADSNSVVNYSRLCNACTSEINYLAKTLKKLFEQDFEESLKFTSGKYNVLRGEMNTTAKVFDKKRIPSGINDMEVILCVDTSGSMQGPNIANAQIAATMLVEACAKINIPCYVMGFSNGHTHFSSWKYNKKQASSIAKMRANGGTDDTRAVRFATELLRRQPAEHKFMFVISDGCGNYGLADAVKDARKIANVFAIGIGNIDTEYFQSVYKQDFLHLTSANGLAKKLSSKVVKLAKRSANK